MSFKHSVSEERIIVMYTNEMINIKAWYKILNEIDIDQVVKYHKSVRV